MKMLLNSKAIIDPDGFQLGIISCRVGRY